MDFIKFEQNRERVYQANAGLTSLLIDQTRQRRKEGTVLVNDITRYELQQEQMRLGLIQTSDARVIALRRMHTATSPYFEPAMWHYPYVLPIILLIGVFEALFAAEHSLESVYYAAVMHYSDLTQETLAQWALPGLWAGCLFSLGWLALMRWTPYRLLAIALLAFIAYAAGFYFLLDANLSIEQLRWPLVCRGFSYAVISVTMMWCLATVMSFQHFFQALSVFNVLHMFVGGVIGGERQRVLW